MSKYGVIHAPGFLVQAVSFKFFAPLNYRSLCNHSIPTRQSLKSFNMALKNEASKNFDVISCCPYSNDTVASFVLHEAEWRTTPVEMGHILSMTNIQAATAFIKGHPEKLVATAMALPMDASLVSNNSAYFLCNVIVAKGSRGNGIARRLVGDVLNKCEENRRAKEVRLLSSEMGYSLYKQLGFIEMDAWVIHYMTRPCVPVPRERGRAQVACAAQEEAAKDLEASYSDRKSTARLRLEPGALCIVIESNSNTKIVAATWVRVASPNIDTGNSGIWIAPVVAETPDLAKEIVCDAIAIWEERNPTPNGIDVQVVVLASGGKGTAVDIFKAVGFETVFEPPLLRKCFNGPTTALPAPSPNYYALTGWHACP